MKRHPYIYIFEITFLLVTSTHKILSYTFIYIYAPSIPGQETPVVPSADAVEPAEAAEGDIYIHTGV